MDTSIDAEQLDVARALAALPMAERDGYAAACFSLRNEMLLVRPATAHLLNVLGCMALDVSEREQLSRDLFA